MNWPRSLPLNFPRPVTRKISAWFILEPKLEAMMRCVDTYNEMGEQKKRRDLLGAVKNQLSNTENKNRLDFRDGFIALDSGMLARVKTQLQPSFPLIATRAARSTSPGDKTSASFNNLKDKYYDPCVRLYKLLDEIYPKFKGEQENRFQYAIVSCYMLVAATVFETDPSSVPESYFSNLVQGTRDNLKMEPAPNAAQRKLLLEHLALARQRLVSWHLQNGDYQKARTTLFTTHSDARFTQELLAHPLLIPAYLELGAAGIETNSRCPRCIRMPEPSPPTAAGPPSLPECERSGKLRPYRNSVAYCVLVGRWQAQLLQFVPN